MASCSLKSILYDDTLVSSSMIDDSIVSGFIMYQTTISGSFTQRPVSSLQQYIWKIQELLGKIMEKHLGNELEIRMWRVLLNMQRFDMEWVINMFVLKQKLGSLFLNSKW